MMGQLSWARWNMQGLLSGHRLEGQSASLFQRRLRRIQRLLEHRMVVFLQEARATLAEVDILRAYFLGVELRGTCGTGPASGGLITILSQIFASEHLGGNL